MKKCECGCGENIPSINKLGNPSRFVHGHNQKGKKKSEESIKKYKKTILNRVNHREVGLSALHTWLRYRITKPEVCQICHRTKPRDLANLTGVYNREFKNWCWLCRSCHNRFDKIMAKLNRLNSPH